MPLAPGVTVDQYGQIVPLVGMPSPATNYGVASAPHFRQYASIVWYKSVDPEADRKTAGTMDSIPWATSQH